MKTPILIPMKTLMPTKSTLSRRAFFGLGTAAAALALAPARLWALTTSEAETLVQGVVADLYDVINSGASEARMLTDFEGFLDRYADMPIIAQQVMGVDWRRASSSQRTRFTAALKTYIARKYGRRFRELIGGDIEVTGARSIRQFFEVTSEVRLRGRSPFQVIWLVSDGSGRPRIFNIVMEGINLSTAEREEVGALLDRNGGNIDALISDLQNAA